MLYPRTHTERDHLIRGLQLVEQRGYAMADRIARAMERERGDPRVRSYIHLLVSASRRHVPPKA